MALLRSILIFILIFGITSSEDATDTGPPKLESSNTTAAAGVENLKMNTENSTANSDVEGTVGQGLDKIPASVGIVGIGEIQTTSGPTPPPKGVTEADPCADAPSKSLKNWCEQLHRWDKNAREAPPVEEAAPKMPAIPGLSDSGLLAAELAPIATTPYQCMDLGCLCQYLNGDGQEGTNDCKLPNGKKLQKALRKEYRMLSDEERVRFHEAIKAVKKSGEYDKIAITHAQFGQAGAAHAGPAFLPWHREFLKRLELALRQIDPDVAIPYWDSTIEGQLPNPSDSHLFTKEFMGDTDWQGNLVVGDFTPWQTTTGTPNVIRHVGKGGKCFSENEIQWFLNQQQIEKILGYSSPQPGACPIRTDYQLIEITHGNVHLFVGGEEIQPPGHMGDTSTSANDPIFFLHHAFIDSIWEQWRQTRQNRNDREMAYPMDNAQCASAMHFGSAMMRPFQPLRNVDGLSNKYTDNLYEYAPRPSCNMEPNCGSKYLFCDRSHGQPHCAAKVRPGGNCQGFFNGEDVCLNGACRGGRCQQTGMEPPTTPRPLPPSTFQPPKPPPESCYNEHECCSVWAFKGECERNPYYMGAWCKASCRQCQFDYDIHEECNNRHKNCWDWSQEGQCQRNKFWMAENCREACGKCQVSRWQVCNGGAGSKNNQDRISATTSARQPKCTSQGCFNENICCQLWGLLGECRRNPLWMSCFCRVSCGNCIPENYVFGSCTDYHLKCWEWAQAGECKRNAWMLENCKQSCGTCVSQNQLRQICQMNNRRGRRRRDIAGGGMPAIEDFEELPLLQRFARNANDTEGPIGPPMKSEAGARDFLNGKTKMPESGRGMPSI